LELPATQVEVARQELASIRLREEEERRREEEEAAKQVGACHRWRACLTL
jgi:hypothetical protein